MEKEPVPITSAIEDIYGDPSSPGSLSASHKKRFSSLLESFQSTYKSRPDFIARSPGRVNIIGEHIDYSLYNVLPMAVLVDTLVAVKVGETTSDSPTKIKIANTKPDQFPTREFDIPAVGEVEIDASKHEWTNYFKAGLRGALGFLQKKESSSSLPDLEILVDGNVPTGNGLSSSAALVCSSALATMYACKHLPSKADLLDLAIVSERAVGVFSGGMDQAASICSSRGSLLYCTFYPKFHSEHVQMPIPNVTYLVAQSFVTSDKHVTAPRCYNLRVVECTLAAVVLAKLHDIVLNPDHSGLNFSLRSFHEEWAKKEGLAPACTEDQLTSLVKLASWLDDSGYTRESISKILGISVETLEKTYMSKFPVDASIFQLRRRAIHVFSEARRVVQFRSLLSSPPDLDSSLERLGSLMNATQDSCRDVYDCSCPEIDEICRIARGAGASGSRLTGAGWGGCTVHLVPEAKVDSVTQALKKDYYAKKFPGMENDEAKMADAIVVSKPGQGSFLIEGF
ncbi:MAG: hypothetical protein Q9160_005301 [Pyrenula sp. 1 TL-2023]